MLRRVSVKYVLNRKMSSSSNPGGSTTQSTEEIAGSIKIPSKYVLIGTPIIVLSSLAVWTINDKRVRYFVEKNISSHFVEFVRTYYGFVDENIEMLKRVEDTVNYQGRNVQLEVYLSSGDIVQIDMPGQTPYREALLSAHLRYGDTFKNVTPKDDIVEDTDVEDSSSGDGAPVVFRLEDWVRSLWDRSLPRALAPRSHIHKFLWFDNIIGNRLAVFNEYLSYGSLDKYLVPRKIVPKISRQAQRAAVLESIGDLELRIRMLELEKQTGRRHIDDADSDIAIERTKIVELRRKYL